MADCVPVKFALRGKTSGDVVVLGSWDGWSQAIKLEKSKDTFEDSTWINLPCGYYEYKFKINDSWIHDKTKPTVLNKFRTLNNFVYVVKGPGIVVSDTSDLEAEKTVNNDRPGDIAGTNGKQEHSQDTEDSMPLIPKLDIAAPTEKQEGNEDFALKVDTNEGMNVKVERQFEPVHVDPVSHVDIKPFEACQQSIEEKESHLQEDTSANVDKPKQEEEDENDAAQQAAETGGDKVITERQLQQEVANYLAKDENLASEGTPKESSRQEGDASNTIQDNTEKVEPASYAVMRPLGKQEDKGANVTKTQTDEDVETLSSQVSDEVVKETAPDEDTAGVPVTIEILDKLAPVEEAYGSAEVDIDEKDTSVKEERRSTSIQDNQSRAEKASDETRIQEEIPVDKQEKKEENAADEEATLTENDDFTTEQKLKQEVADYLAKDNKNLTAEVAPEETDIDNKAGDVSEAVSDSIDDVKDDTGDKTVSQNDQPDEVVKHKLGKVPDKKTDKTLPLEETGTKTVIECLEKEADEPVVEKEHSQYEKPLSAAQNDLTIETDSIVSPKTDKNDHKIIHGIPEIKAYVLSDEVPPQQKEPDAGKDLKKETPHKKETVTKGSVETVLQPGERKVAKAFDEIALTRDATNNVETMVHSVVEEITKTAIQEAGKDVGKTSPQQRTTESTAIDDLKKTTRKKLTKASANQDVAKKAVLREFNTKEVDKAIAGETPQQPSQEAADTTAQDNLKVEIQVTTQTTSQEVFPNGTGAKQQKADKDGADEFKNAEVAPPQADTTAAVPSDTDKTETLVERLHEKVKDEQPIVIDVVGTTEIKLGAMTDPETTEQDKPSKTPGKTTTEAEIRQKNAGVLENIHKEDLPEKGATKDIVSDLGKGVETVADKGACEETTTDTFVQENVEMAPDKAEEEMKPTHEKQEKPTTKQGEKPTTEKEEKSTPKEEEKPTPEKEETPTFKEEKPTTEEEEPKKPTPKEEEKPSPEKEETSTTEKEEKPIATPKEQEKPSPEKEETSTTEKEEKPTPKEEEKPTPEKEETPTFKEEKPTTEEEEMPTTEKADTPTPKEEEKPTLKKEEKPPSEKEEKPTIEKEKPTTDKEEKPTTEKEEIPATEKEETPSLKKEDKPTNEYEQTPTPKEETPTPKEEEKPTPKEKPTPEEEEKPSTTVKEETPTLEGREKPTTEEQEKATTKKEEKPTPKEEKPIPKEEKPTPKEETPTPKKEEKPTPKEEKPTSKEEKPTPREDEKPTPKNEEKPTTKQEEKPKPKEEEKPTPNEEEKPLPKPKEEERPTPTKEDIPTHRKGERPTPKKEEMPTPKKEERPTPKKEERPTPTKEETPIPKKQERPTHEIVGKPTTKKEEKLVTETEEKPKALATPTSTEDTKKKEGPTSRFAFWKKKKEEQKPGLKKEEKPEQVKSTTEEPTTEKNESKTSNDDTKTPGFLGLLRCCRCF